MITINTSNRKQNNSTKNSLATSKPAGTMNINFSEAYPESAVFLPVTLSPTFILLLDSKTNENSDDTLESSQSINNPGRIQAKDISQKPAVENSSDGHLSKQLIPLEKPTPD